MAVATNSKTQIPADWRQVSLGDVLTLGTVFLCLSPNPPSRVVGALERDVRGKETRLSGRIWGRLGQWLPLVAVGRCSWRGRRQRETLAGPSGTSWETFDWLAGEDDVRGVPAADHAIRKGVAGRAAGRGRQWPAHPRANRWGGAG